jgi:hypothetical protein
MNSFNRFFATTWATPSNMYNFRLYAVLVLLFVVCVQVCCAGSGYWVKLSGPGTETDVRVFAENSLGHLYVGCGSGKVWKTTDNGTSWVQTGNLPFSGNVWGLSVDPSDFVIASVYGSGVCRSTDGGVSWQAKNTGLSSYNVRMNLVDRIGNVWVASEGGVFRSTNAGESWSVKKSGSFGVLLMDSIGAVITTSYSSSYRTTDGGSTWETFADPTGCSLLGIHPNGYYFDGNYPCGLARSTNRGATWSTLTTPFDGLTGNEGAKLTFDPTGTVYMSMGNGGVAASTDFGDTWTVISSTLPTSSWTQLFGLSNGYAFLSLAGYGVYRTTVPNITIEPTYWISTYGPGTNGDVNALAVNSQGVVYAGTRGLGAVWYTTDQGVVWHQTAAFSSPNRVECISINSMDHIFSSVIGSGVYRSTDLGASWQLKNTGLTNLTVRMTLWDRNGNVYVATEGGIFKSTNNADSWTKVRNGSYGGLMLDSTGAVVTNASSSFERSSDGGASWEVVSLPYGISLGGVHPNGDYYAGWYDSKAYRSTDRGATWTELPHPLSGFSSGMGLYFAFNGRGEAFFSVVGGGVGRSTDDGTTWTIENSGLTTTQVGALLIAPDGFLYVATAGRGVFRSRVPTSAGAYGHLKITMREGDQALPGTTGHVVLYGNSGTKKDETWMDAASTAWFHYVEPGSGYSIKVYSQKDDGTVPWGECYLGEAKGIAIVGEDTTRIEFVPTTPRITSTKVFVDSTNELLPFGTAKGIAPGTRLRIELQVKNPPQSGKTFGAFVTVVADRDKMSPNDFLISSNAQVLESGVTKTFTLHCTPTALGEYYFSGRVKAWDDVSDSLVTDGTVWEAPAFQVEYSSPWTFVNTGNTHTVIFPLSGYYSIRNAPLKAGDFIGVFFDSSGTAVCAGFEQWTGTGNIAVSAFGDDPTTPTKDGFATGEAFTWKVCRPDSGAIYDVDATYLLVGGVITHTGTFAVNGVSSVQALTDPGEIRCPVLRSGWSLISSNVAPYETSLDSVFGSVLGDLIILKNGAQQSFIPAVPVNSIGNWDRLQGYQLKMKRARTLCFNGQKIVPQTQTVPIPAGWSIIPYYRDSVMSIEAALSGIASDVVIVKDQDGRTYLPSVGVNTIGTLKPGEGYYIKLAAEHTLVYPASVGRLGAIKHNDEYLPLEKTGTTPPWFYGNTGVSHTIIIPLTSNPRLGSTALAEGDYIGVFYDSSGATACAGFGIWAGSSNLAIAAFGDDATTTQKDGFTSAEGFKWKIWHQADAHVYSATATYVPAGSLGGVVTDSGRYVTNGISALSSLIGSLTDVEHDAIPATFRLLQNYPNPFNPTTSIGYSVGVDSRQPLAAARVRLAVYDLLGREVAVLVDEAKQPGYYTVQFDAAHLASGIYMYRLTAGEFVAVKRLTLLR